MSGIGWLREDSPDEWRIDRIDPCEAGTCGHAGCWQDTPRAVAPWADTDTPDTRPLIVAATTPADPMQPATRLYCGHDPLMAAEVAAWHEARTGERVQVTGGTE